MLYNATNLNNNNQTSTVP